MSRLAARLLPLFLLACVVAVSTGCSSGPNIYADYDREADFSAYKTYDFFQKNRADGSDYTSLFDQHVTDAIAREMDARGYTRSDKPDLLVNFHAMLQERTTVTEVPGSYYGYRGGHYAPWGGYGYGTRTHVSQYTEGTFNIDLIDAKTNQMVWEAVSIGRVNAKYVQQIKARIDELVPLYFERYPFRAGSGEPVEAETH